MPLGPFPEMLCTLCVMASRALKARFYVSSTVRMLNIIYTMPAMIPVYVVIAKGSSNRAV